jgi:cullin 1
MAEYGSSMSGGAIITLEEGWNNEIKTIALDPLEAMLDDGFKQKKKLFSNTDYIKVYTTCYNMCTQKVPFNWSEQLYRRHGETISNYLSSNVLPVLKAQRNEELLAEFVRRGDNHKVMNDWHRKFFQYLDRYHVKYHQLPSLEDAGVRYFKTIIFDAIKKDVTDAIVRLVNVEREKELVIDRGLIRSCIQIYEAMGMKSLDTYVADFETHLLVTTKEYYTRKAEEWIAEDSTPTYMLKIEAALEEERSRVQSYLNPESETKLLNVIEMEALEKRETELIEKEGSGCKVLLINDMNEDLSRMYRLFSRITNGLDPIAEIFRSHITDMGTEKIEQRLSRCEGAAKDKETNDDPEFIKDLLSVHDKFLGVVSDRFCGNALFQKALKDAFVELVNREVGKFNTADLISSFCDRLLKTGSSEKLSDDEVEEYLEKTVQLFSYLTDKDLFAEIYRNQLAKRLLNQRSASNDMERAMIGKLKLRCGAQFTAKMEGMLNDLAIGTDLSQNFEKFCRENPDKTGLGKMEFGVQVLTAGHWPTYKTVELTLPKIMQRCTQVYKEYYDGKGQLSNRRLQWSYSLGNATIKGTFAKGKTYDIAVTTLQAVALLAFNGDNLTISFETLMESLGITEEILKRVMHSLSCGKFKVLKRISEGGGTDAKGPIKITDIFSFNDAFTCQMRKIRIPMASLDDANSVKRVEEDRSIAIEAATVRIMKARKQLSHQQLVAEVLTQLSFFSPPVKMIKKRIEALIDREYLERDPENPTIYKYLA